MITLCKNNSRLVVSSEWLKPNGPKIILVVGDERSELGQGGVGSLEYSHCNKLQISLDYIL